MKFQYKNTFVLGTFIAIFANFLFFANTFAADAVTHTLYLDGNGGTTVGHFSCQTTEESPECYVVISGEKPSRDGYAFFGYADSPDATEPTYTAGDEYIFTNVDTDAIVYAVWGSGDIIRTEGTTHINGSDENLMVEMDYPTTNFRRVLIDYVEVPSEYYTVTSGSTIVVVDSAFLDTLQDGNHLLIISHVSTNATLVDFTTYTEPDPDDPVNPDDPSDSEDNIDDDEVIKIPDTGANQKNETSASCVVSSSILCLALSLIALASAIILSRRAQSA